MNCSDLVDILSADEQLAGLLAKTAQGPAIFQILSPEWDIYPRLAVTEINRKYTMFADDAPIEERVDFGIDIFARENVLYAIQDRINTILRRHRFIRDDQVKDDYLPEIDIFVKTVRYSIRCCL